MAAFASGDRERKRDERLPSREVRRGALSPDELLSRLEGQHEARPRLGAVWAVELLGPSDDAEGLPEDPDWRRGMPEFQGSEFNHFVGIANGVNHILVPHATVLLSEVETLEARWGWLSTMVALGAERALRLQLDDTAEPQEHQLSPPWTVFRTFGVEGPCATTVPSATRTVACAISPAISPRDTRPLGPPARAGAGG